MYLSMDSRAECCSHEEEVVARVKSVPYGRDEIGVVEIERSRDAVGFNGNGR